MEKFIKSEADYEKMSADGKIGLVATIDEQGSPHITFLSSIQPLGDNQMTVGQFCDGLSKKFFKERKKVGFLILSADIEIWSGRGEYRETRNTGPEFDVYNNKPLFRYNTYFGFGCVHYFDIISMSEKSVLKMSQVITGALKTRILSPFKSVTKNNILNHEGKRLFSQIDGLKFISYIDEQGYPVIVPIIQACNAGTDRIIFSSSPFKEDVKKIPNNTHVAVLFVNLKMQSLLVKGQFKWTRDFIKNGQVDIERVYNSMPPFTGYIYPITPINKVIDF